jgi:hypothetical protein
MGMEEFKSLSNAALVEMRPQPSLFPLPLQIVILTRADQLRTAGIGVMSLGVLAHRYSDHSHLGFEIQGSACLTALTLRRRPDHSLNHSAITSRATVI